MYGIKVEVDCLNFAAFRKPTSTSLLLSYSIPPYTTIRGLLSNALGMARDDYSIQEWIKIGINPIKCSDKSKELAKTLKLISREMKFRCLSCNTTWTSTTKSKECPYCKSSEQKEIPNYKRVFSSTPMFKEILVTPRYDIFLGGEEGRIKQLYNALIQPSRPLYIGASDDLVDVEVTGPYEITQQNTRSINGVIEGVHEKCIIEKIPFKFMKRGKDYSLEYKTVSIPQKGGIDLDKDVSSWQFGNENIWLV